MAKKYKYIDADEVLTVNDNDPDLQPIHIPLPPQPRHQDIDGYGLPPEDQFWKPIPLPPKLLKLQRSKTTLRQKIEKVNQNPLAFKNEIQFIKDQWYKRIHGHWFFNNGKATYITGDHYFYLNSWHLDTGLPAYRSRDRKFYLFAKFCDEDPFCYGFCYPKFRREGATFKTKAWEANYMMRTSNAHSGMQSMNDDSAKTLFQHKLIEPWRKLPFFFQPVHDGTSNPKSGLYFQAPAYKQTEDNMDKDLLHVDALDSSMSFSNSGVKAYDGWKLHRYHDDECGKVEECDVYERWRVVRPCLNNIKVMDGVPVIGKSIHTSTVGEMSRGGGRNFKVMCDDSMYDKRDPKTKRTKSWLYLLFIPSSEGYEGVNPETGKSLIDKYGNSDVELNKNIILNLRAGYEKDNNYEALADIYREAPLTYRECWRQASKAQNFNTIILQTRIDQLNEKNIDKVRGNFKWVDNVKDTMVEWEPDPTGRFYCSYFFENPGDSNKFYVDGAMKFPGHTSRFIAGADPFRFKETLNRKKSSGAGAVFYKYDYVIDANSDISKWKSNRFVCTYCFRPRDKHEYGEDMIKMCVYFGCEMNPEINVDFIWDYFQERGYGGYLFFRRDRKTGLTIATPGQTTTDKVKEAIFNEYMTYIQKHGMREVHDELLQQCLEIENDMTDFDLFVAGGYALLGAMKPTPAQEYVPLDVGEYFQFTEIS